jgi:isoleucyl-tRNA synthetase
VALDLELTDDLIAEGTAREIVRGVQDLRKTAGLAVEDRIELWLDAEGAATLAVEAHKDFIANETLATTVHLATPEGVDGDEIALDQGSVRFGLRKATNY